MNEIVWRKKIKELQQLRDKLVKENNLLKLEIEKLKKRAKK